MLTQLDQSPVVPKMARATIFLAFFGNGFLATCWVVHIPRIRGLLGLSDGELGLILWAATLGFVSRHDAGGMDCRTLPQPVCDWRGHRLSWSRHDPGGGQ